MVTFWAIYSGSGHRFWSLSIVLDKDDLVSGGVLDFLLEHVCFLGTIVFLAISALAAT